jgi:two-component system chemotaxis response regulator CheY
MAKTVLIVDDSASMRTVLTITLTGAGYDVLQGCNGQDALAKLTGQKVHLIISDVNMPVMDGISFLKSVKQIPAYKFTPVLMLTTESAEEKKREGQSAGARAWVCKPFSPPKLLDAVQRLCLP